MADISLKNGAGSAVTYNSITQLKIPAADDGEDVAGGGTAENCVALQLTCESGAFTPQAPCMLEFLTADGWLDLSAEL